MPSPLDTSQLTTVKAPPRKRTGTRAAAVPTDTRTPRERREQGLIGLGQVGVAGCLLAKQYADAGAIGKYWTPIARESAVLAESNESVAKVIDILTEFTPYTALVLAVMPLVLQIMANHGVINADNAMVGGSIVPPAILEAQIKADMARLQAEALREQQMALAEAAQAQADYEAEMAKSQTAVETESVE